MSIFSKYKIYLIIFSSILISVIGSLIYFNYYKESDEIIINDLPISMDSTNEEVEEEKEEFIEPVYYKVDIKGAIKKPGVYNIKENSRVIDVINLAGGLNKNADTTYINLSKKVFDEMVIIIYTKEKISDIKKHLEEEKQIVQKLKEENTNDPLVQNTEEEEENETTIKLISINTATKEEFMTLNGIGEKKALDIINYIEENGPFKAVEEIMNVSGIGEALFAKIKDYITL